MIAALWSYYLWDFFLINNLQAVLGFNLAVWVLTFWKAGKKKYSTEMHLSSFSWRLFMPFLLSTFHFPMLPLAAEMSICCPALALPLCTKQSVFSDSTDVLWGAVVSTLAAQLVDCQLHLVFPHPCSVPATFLLPTSEPISVCNPYEYGGNQMVVKVHKKPVGWTNTLIFFFIFLHPLFPSDSDSSSSHLFWHKAQTKWNKGRISPGEVCGNPWFKTSKTQGQKK